MKSTTCEIEHFGGFVARPLMALHLDLQLFVAGKWKRADAHGES